MTNRNTMEPLEYILDNFFWGILAMIWFRNIYFIRLPGLTLKWSKIILWVLVVGFMALGCAMTFRKRRNRLSLWVNLLLPYELYIVITYRAYVPGRVWGVLVFSGILSITFLILALLPDRQAEESEQIPLERRLKHGALGARTIFSICMLILPLLLGIQLIANRGLLVTNVKPVKNTSEASEWFVSKQIDVVRKLQEEEWQELSDQEKLDVLGVVTNIEVRYLGLNHELYLKSGVLKPNVASNYNHKEYAITISIDHLRSDSAREILDSLCHECYHSYQHQMIELYDLIPEEYRDMLAFRYADDYVEELSDYADGTDDIDAYYGQTVEATARGYAAQAVQDYYERIEECLQSAA